MLVCVHDTKDNETQWLVEWKHLTVPSFKKRLSWISASDAKHCIEVQVSKKYIEPKFVIDYVGPRVRPDIRGQFGNGAYPPLNDTRYIERSVYFKGFSEPVVMTEFELYG